MSKLLRAVAVTGLLFVIVVETQALDVIYNGNQGTLTDAQRQDVLNFLLGHHTPELAMAIFGQMTVVQGRAGLANVTVTLQESFPGELLFCHTTAAVGARVVNAQAMTLAGDGLFQGGPISQQAFTWGDVLMFHGASSTNQAMTINLNLTLEPFAAPPTPIERIDLLSSRVHAAVLSGSIRNGGIGQALTTKLDAAKRGINAGTANATIGQLRALINQLQAQSGKLVNSVFAEEIIIELQILIEDIQQAPQCTVTVIGPPMICAGQQATYTVTVSPDNARCTFTVLKGGDLGRTATAGNVLTVTTLPDKTGTMQIKVECVNSKGAICEHTFEIDVGIREIELKICLFLVKNAKGGVTMPALTDPDFKDLGKDNKFRGGLVDSTNVILKQICVKFKIKIILDLELGDEFFDENGNLKDEPKNFERLKERIKELLKAAGLEDSGCLDYVIARQVLHNGKIADGSTFGGVSLVSELQPQEPSRRLPRTFAHETGHLLGLKDLEIGQFKLGFFNLSPNNDPLIMLMTPWSPGRQDADKLSIDEARTARKEAEKAEKTQEKK